MMFPQSPRSIDERRRTIINDPRRRGYYAASLLLFISTSAIAGDCKSITDATTRLACFDKASAPAKTVKKPIDDPAIEAAKGAIVATKARLFKDAGSLKDVAIGKPFACLSGVGTCVCMEANGKTSAGGYSEIQLLLVKIIGPTETEMTGECSNQNYAAN